MQRYRVNYKLLIGLVVGFFISAGSAYGLWLWQVDRNASKLIGRANELINKGERLEALEALTQYINLRPDDARAVIYFANLSEEFATDFLDEKWLSDFMSYAMYGLNEGVAKTEVWKQNLQNASADEKSALLEEISPRAGETVIAGATDGEGVETIITEEELRQENAALREKLAAFYLDYRSFESHRALEHIEKLLAEDDGSDAERTEAYHTLKIRCLAKNDERKFLEYCRQLIGLTNREFDDEAALNQHVPQAYSSVAFDLMIDGTKSDKQLANMIIERMVEQNPESVVAHSNRYNFYRAVAQEHERDAAKEEENAVRETNPRLKENAEQRTEEARALAQTADEAARVSLAKAAELGPNEADVLLKLGQQALRDFTWTRRDIADLLGPRAEGILKQLVDAKTEEELRNSLEYERLSPDLLETIVAKWRSGRDHLQAAIGHFDTGLEQHPTVRIFFELAAEARFNLGELDEALRVVSEGQKTFSIASAKRGLRVGLGLSNSKVDILLAKNDLQGVRDEIRELRDTKLADYEAVADLHLARLHMVEQRWKQAEDILELVVPQLFAYTQDFQLKKLAANAGTMLGLSQERLGKNDLAFESYKMVVDRMPGDVRARQRLFALLPKMGRRAPDVPGSGDDIDLGTVVPTPEGQQDWDALDDKVDDLVRREEITEGEGLIRKARIRLRQAGATADKSEQERFKVQARSLAEQTIDAKGDPRANLWMAIPVIATTGVDGPQQSLELLQNAIGDQTLPDTSATREMHAKLIRAVGGPELGARLIALTQGMEDWDPRQRSGALSGIAWQLQSVGRPDDAWRLMKEAADLIAQDPPAQQELFNLAFLQKDDIRMQEAQKSILRVMGDESEPNYVLNEARRKVIAFYNRELDRQGLAQVRSQLESLRNQRPDWRDLQRLIVQVKALLGENAVDDEMAADLNDPSMVALRVNLLAQQGRFEEAQDQLKLIPSSMRTDMLQQLHADLLEKAGDIQGAYKAASEFAATQPNAPAVQIWFARIARAAGQMDEAEETLQRVAELSPNEIPVWRQLVSLYIKQKDSEKIVETLRRAQLGVDEDQLPDWMANYYQLYRRWPQAEKILLSIYGHRLDDPLANRQLAQFYIARADDDRYDTSAAAPYINRILKDVYTGKLDPHNTHARWARRQAAQLLFAKGDYPNSSKAERLLTKYYDPKSEELEEIELLISILSARRDPASYLQLIEILKQTDQRSGLGPMQTLLLGQKLSRVSRWQESRELLEDAVLRYPEHAGLIAGYAALLIENGEYKDAERTIRRLSDLPRTSGAAWDLEVKLAAAEGDKNQVRRLLQRNTPKFKSGGEKELAAVPALVRRAERAGDYEFALGLMAEYVKRVPTAEFDFARLMAYHGDAKRGLGMLQTLFDKDEGNSEEILVAAVQMYRQRKAEYGEGLDVEMNQLIRRAIRRDSESAHRLIAQAQVLEVQGRFEEAVESYENLLARSDLPQQVRATAGNNLAYLLGLKPTGDNASERALAAANEAIEIFGPISEILDTRAVVHLSAGDYEQALNDMDLAILVDPTGGKYYHLAKAHLGLGNVESAITAWQKAVELGVGPESISSIEQDDVYRFQQKIEALANSSAQRQ